MSLLDDYRLLALETNASEQEAKTAYRNLARIYHPDKNPEQDTTEHFQNLQTAYQNILSAIRQGIIIQDWQRYDFTDANSSSHMGEHTTESDEIQRQYIKERQHAYEEMKRNTQSQEQAKQAALRRARNTINEKKAKEMYEQAFKSSNYTTSFTATDENSTESDSTKEVGIDPSLFDTFEQILKENDRNDTVSTHNNSASLIPIKLTLRAISYLATFAIGVYTTLYWQDQVQRSVYTSKDIKQTEFVAGLYPQFRSAINYTLDEIDLYAAPDKNTTPIFSIPKASDLLVTNSSRAEWLAVRYQDTAGWVEEKNIGFGSVAQANSSNCFGTPGVAPLHGSLLSSLEVQGKNRLRLINQLPKHSLLTFESYEGAAPFSVYLNGRQSLAINYIPKGRYRLLLHTGALFHNNCQQFLFDQGNTVLLDQIEFTGAEQTLTLSL